MYEDYKAVFDSANEENLEGLRKWYNLYMNRTL